MSLPIRRHALRPLQQRCTTTIRPHTIRHITTQKETRREKESVSPQTLRERAQVEDPKLFEKSDFGMLPGTFIRAWDTTPPLLPRPLYPLDAGRIKRALADRWKYEKTWLKARIRDTFVMFNYKFRVRRGPRLKGVFWHARVQGRADELYEKLYYAFASKDTDPIKDLCTEGLLKNITDRIAGRPEGVNMTWRILARHGWPWSRVVSNRFGYLPVTGADDKDHPYVIRQLVLRKSTRQVLRIERQRQPDHRARVTGSSGTTLQRKRRLLWSPDGDQPGARGRVMEEEEEWDEEVKGEERHDKNVVEYLVLQQVMVRGELKDWRLWGFADKTTVQSIEENETKEEELAALQTR
ncbi:uncharacterized protein EI97DRAFT_430603 [Westerdykella ornata]|uniref:Tim44-like domain-containing protein n=1 Tax=Westerdykella ornata TaxID=318751 RepID=A0A6A6JSH0_WESOR|nr:uncharacterized protein EI97DRAFT_430603 [Westerdykella ornata]KAF2279551.1 hypothetical protein EI97DRAFT_430603 [Westerdykella ornata]